MAPRGVSVAVGPSSAPNRAPAEAVRQAVAGVDDEVAAPVEGEAQGWPRGGRKRITLYVPFIITLLRNFKTSLSVLTDGFGFSAYAQSTAGGDSALSPVAHSADFA